MGFTGDLDRSGVEIPAPTVAEAAVGGEPAAGGGVEAEPNNEANGFIRASLPAGALVSLISATEFDVLDLLRGGNGRLVLSADSVDDGKWDADEAGIMGRSADSVAVRVIGSRIAAKIEESAGRVVSKASVDLPISVA